MQGSNESRAHVVTDPAAARLLADPRRHGLLMAFAPRPRTVSEVASAAGVSLLRVWRVVRQALALGLLREAGAVPRAGRPMRRYQTVANAFLVPDSLLPALPSADLARAMRDALVAHRCRFGAAHLFTAGPDGQVLIRPLDEARSGVPVREMWRVLRLAPAEAEALAAAIDALLRPFEARQAGGQPWLVHAALAPKPPAIVADRIP